MTNILTDFTNLLEESLWMSVDTDTLIYPNGKFKKSDRIIQVHLIGKCIIFSDNYKELKIHTSD